MSTITPLTEADTGRGDLDVNNHTPYRGLYREGRSGGSTITPLTEADTGRGDQGCQQSHSSQRLIQGGEIVGVNRHTPYRG